MFIHQIFLRKIVQRLEQSSVVGETTTTDCISTGSGDLQYIILAQHRVQ
jgi:hypothetical protein